jgi:hypothetical protein
MGWTRKRRNALVKIVTAKSGIVVDGEIEKGRLRGRVRWRFARGEAACEGLVGERHVADHERCRCSVARFTVVWSAMNALAL